MNKKITSTDPMTWLRTCLNCQENVYQLNDGMLKCSLCKKKYSPQRVNKIITLITCFNNDESALSTSKRLGISYVSTQKYFKQFRQLCAEICEHDYELVREKSCEYEEYYYLEPSKKHKKDTIFDANNFLTFDYEGHIYAILMPSLHKSQFLQDNMEDKCISELQKFKRKSRIIKVSTHFNNIVKFWEYFEKAILKYKGVNTEAFPFFLKEIEFKFNHPIHKRQLLLEIHYFKGNTYA